MLLQKISYLIVPRYPALQFLPILWSLMPTYRFTKYTLLLSRPNHLWNCNLVFEASFLPASGEADIEGYFKVLNGRLDPSSLFHFLVRIKLCSRNKIGQPLLYKIERKGYDLLIYLISTYHLSKYIETLLAKQSLCPGLLNHGRPTQTKFCWPGTYQATNIGLWLRTAVSSVYHLAS